MNNDSLIEREAELAYSKASENFKYPKGVVSNQDYDNYLIFSEKWKNHVQRFYTLKNKKTLDLALSPNRIEESLKQEKLIKTEIELIRKINKEIYYLVQKATLYKKRAFGDNRSILTEEGFIADDLSGCTPVIIDLAGRFFKPEEIHQSLCEDMEITTISVSQIKTVIKNNISKIKELQEKYKKDYSDIRLGYKRSRLEELQLLYNQRKSIYNKSYNREDEKQLTSLLNLIKQEVQGDLTVNLNANVSIEEKANDYVKNEILKSLNVSMFIIAKMAGRMNINPLLLISRLAHSRYAQFTGFSENGLSPTAQTDEISYTSNLTYNWGAIEVKNQQILEEDKKLAELPKIDKPKQVISLREKLLERLKQAEQPLQKGKESIDLSENN